MIKLLYTLCLSACFYLASATLVTGVYSFNKGMNKASGTLYINQFSEDSAFFLLETVSGMPDFIMTDAKGFLRIENNTAFYRRKDTCGIEFLFTTTSCSLTENGSCRFEFSPNGKYKKTSNVVKKCPSLLPAMADKSGIISKDSVYGFVAPHRSAPLTMMINKGEEVQITDEYNGFI
jgi:hypothetical protein